MLQLPVEKVDDSKIQDSSLLKIFNVQDESILDQELSRRRLPEFDLLIKKITLILIGRASGLLSEKASEIISDSLFVKSLFEMKPDLNRLKKLLKYEMDDRVLKDINERFRTRAVSYDELYTHLNNFELYFEKIDSENKLLKEELSNEESLNNKLGLSLSNLQSRYNDLVNSFNSSSVSENDLLSKYIDLQNNYDSKLLELEDLKKKNIDLNLQVSSLTEDLKESGII